MAKYKYDVYEIADYYSTKTISGTERTERFSKYTRQVSVYKFYSSSGNFSYYGNVNVENSEGYYYVLNNDYYKITEGFFSGGGSQGYGYLKLIKIQITKANTRGDLIESIVAEENTYPTNGIKDGKWYIRREIIQERKISVKDSGGKLINIASIYFKDNNSNIINIAKAYSDKELLWEKSTDKTISWTTSSQVSPYANNLIVPRDNQSELKDKQIISVKIGDLGEVVDGINNSVPYLKFSKSFDELLGTNDWIPAGTQITVKYK